MQELRGGENELATRQNKINAIRNSNKEKDMYTTSYKLYKCTVGCPLH